MSDAPDSRGNLTFLDAIGVTQPTLLGTPRTGTGSPLGASDTASELQRMFAPRFQQTFTTSMSTVLTDALQGRFDDPTLTAETETLVQRLGRQASIGQSQLGAPGLRAPVRDAIMGGGPAASAGGGGAHAAPDAAAATGVAGVAATADERRLLEIYSQQAEGRLSRVSASLHGRLGQGAAMPSAASGQLDIHNFKPQNEQQAAAFAERLAIDLTEGAARLDVVGTKLELARFDAQAGSTQAAALVVSLEREYDAQQAFVIDVATVVDGASGNSIAKTAASTPDSVELSRVADTAAREGVERDDAELLSGAYSFAAEEDLTGNSQLVNNLRQDLSTVLINWMAKDAAKDRIRAQEEEDKFIRQKLEDRRLQYQALKANDAAITVQRLNEARAQVAAMYKGARTQG